MKNVKSLNFLIDAKYKKPMGALVGNIMQFYDFTLYALLTPQLNRTFFNFDNKYLSYIIVFGVFACGYLTRPLGSLLFGFLGDKQGRSRALSKTIILATIATFLIGVLPGYSTIGFLAPIFLLILRLLQGLAVSGEEGGAVVLLFEKYSFKHQGIIGSLVLSSVLVGVMLGIVICTITNKMIPPEAINFWGWRLPFLFSLPLGIVATMMRFYLNDFNLFQWAEKNHLLVKQPIHLLFKNHFSNVLFGVCVVSAYSVTTSTLIVHIPYFLTIKAGLSQSTSLNILGIAIFTTIFLAPIFGKLLGKKSPFLIYQTSLFGLIIFSPNLFYILGLGNEVLTICAITLFSILIAVISSTVFSLLVDSFPFGVRCSGVSLSFNLSITIFSSTTPMILILIENYYTSPFTAGSYIAVLLSVSFITTKLLNKNSRRNFSKNELGIYKEV